MGVLEYLSDNPEVLSQGVQWSTAFTAGLIWGYGQAKKDKQFPEDVRGASETEGLAVMTSVPLEGFEDVYYDVEGKFDILDFGEYVSTGIAAGYGVVYGRRADTYLEERKRSLEEMGDALNPLKSE